jgi:hypothetical protein
MSLFRAALGEDESGWMASVPGVFQAGPVKAWLSQRDLPSPPARTFRQLWAERRSGEALRE